MTDPVVSVILPVYNGENYLRYAIESVLNQTFHDFELIVVDDGSTDATPSIAGEYRTRLKHVRQQNTGVAGAFNHGITLAAGRYISWLSHDDVFLPNKLARQVEELDKCSEPAAAYTDIQIIDGGGGVSTEYRLPAFDKGGSLREIITGGPLCMASYSIMYHRKCISEVGSYSLRWRYLQDAEMLARLASRFPLIHVADTLMQVREHQDRGVHSEPWQREAASFYKHQLNTFSLADLFATELNRLEKSEARQWLGDRLAALPFPVYRLALSQYRLAMNEHPGSSLRVLRKAQWVIRRYLRDYLMDRH